MLLSRYQHTAEDPWYWRLSDLTDTQDIVKLAEQHFEHEVDQVFTTSARLFARHIDMAAIEQHYDPLRLQLIVARSWQDHSLLGYAWLNRAQYMTYAPEEMAEAAFLHLNMQLPRTQRIRLSAQVLEQWYLWCQVCGIPVLVSTTVRQEQRGFLRLHELAGFTIRGSFAFRRVDLGAKNESKTGN